jgi:hypothetical protein
MTRTRSSALRVSSIAACAGALAAACAATGSYSYKLYPGPARPVSELAVIRMADAATAELDGRVATSADWTHIELLPGTHRIRWQTEFGVSVMIEPSGFATGGNSAEVTLSAGHVYALRADRTTGFGYQMYFWILDETAGEVIAGTPKP